MTNSDTAAPHHQSAAEKHKSSAIAATPRAAMSARPTDPLGSGFSDAQIRPQKVRSSTSCRWPLIARAQDPPPTLRGQPALNLARACPPRRWLLLLPAQEKQLTPCAPSPAYLADPLLPAGSH
jgi:hypothetical protein